MASVDLGLRLLMEDYASTGLSGFQSLLRDLISTAASGAGGLTNFASAIASQDAAALAAGRQIADYGAQLELLSVQSAQADTAVAAMRDELVLSGQMTDVAGVMALQEDLALTEQELARATSQLALWNETLAASGGTDANAAAQDAFYSSEVNRLEGEVQMGAASVNAFGQQTVAQANALNNAEASALSYQMQMTSLNTAIQDSTTAQAAATQASADLAAQQAQAAQTAMQYQASVALLAGGGVGLVGAALATADLIKQGSMLQDVMANLTVAFHLNSTEADQMSASITSVASQSRFTEQQVGDAFTALGEYGQSAAAVMGTQGDNGVGKAAIQLAEAIRTQTVPAAQLLSQTMTLFKAPAKDAAYYASMLDYAFYHGIPDIQQLGTVISDVGGKTSELNIPIDQLISTMDFLTRSGLKASTAATSLRYILSSFSSPTAAAEKALRDMGVVTIDQATPAFQQFTSQLDAAAAAAGATATPFDGTLTSLNKMFTQAQSLHVPMAVTDKTFNQWATSLGLVQNKLLDTSGNVKPLFTDIQTLGDAIRKMPPVDQIPAIQSIFNVRSGQDAQLLLTNIDGVMKKLQGYDQQAKQFAQGGKGVQTDATTITSTFPGEMAKLSTTVSSFIGKVAQPLMGVLAQIAGGFNTLAGHLNGLDSNTRRMTYTFLALWGGLSAVAVVAGLVIMAFTATVSPVVAIAFAVAGGILLVATAGTWLSGHWREVKPVLDMVLAAVAGLAGAAGFMGLVGPISTTTGLLGAFRGIGPGFVSAMNSMAIAIGKGMMAGIQWVQNLPKMIAGMMTEISTNYARATAWLAANWPMLVFVAIAILVGLAIMALVQHFGGLHLLLVMAQSVWRAILPSIQMVGNELKGAFLQAINQLKPTWTQLVQAFHLAQPALLQIGMVLGGVLAVAIAVAIGLLNGLIRVVGALLVAFVGILTGAVKIFGGLITFFTGFFMILSGLFTGNWKLIIQGFGTMGTGIEQIVSGIWTIIKSIFVGGWNAIVGFMQGFVSGVVGFFTHLMDVLVGHSIVPDMWRMIQQWFISIPNAIIGFIVGWIAGLIGHFTQLASMALAAFTLLWQMGQGAFRAGISAVISLVSGLPGQIVGLLSGLGSMLFNSGLNAINMLANGIMSGIGAVGSAVSSVASKIAGILGFHSPPREGILADSDTYMPNMMKMYGTGILQNQHHVTGAISTVATAIHRSFTTPTTQATGGLGGGSAAGGLGGGTTIQFMLDSKVVGQAVLDHASGQLRMSGLTRRMR